MRVKEEICISSFMDFSYEDSFFREISRYFIDSYPDCSQAIPHELGSRNFEFLRKPIDLPKSDRIPIPVKLQSTVKSFGTRLARNAIEIANIYEAIVETATKIRLSCNFNLWEIHETEPLTV